MNGRNSYGDWGLPIHNWAFRIHNYLKLVTINIRHFNRIPELEVIKKP